MGCCSSANNGSTTTTGSSDDPRGPGYENPAPTDPKPQDPKPQDPKPGNEYKNDDKKQPDLDGKSGIIKMNVDGKELFVTTPTQLESVKITNPRVRELIKRKFKSKGWRDGKWWKLPKELDGDFITDSGYSNDNQQGQEQQPGQEEQNQPSAPSNKYAPDSEEAEVMSFKSAMSATTEYTVEFTTTINGEEYGIKEGRIGKSKHLHGTENEENAATVTFKLDEGGSNLWLVYCNKTVNIDGVATTDDWCMTNHSDGKINWESTLDDAMDPDIDDSHAQWRQPRFGLPYHLDANPNASNLSPAPTSDHLVFEARERQEYHNSDYYCKITVDDVWTCDDVTANRIVSFTLWESS